MRRIDGMHPDRCFGGQDPAGFLDPESTAWSPDGRKLAITEAYRLGLEPDIHVVDVESGRLTNLTDDGIAQQGSIGAGAIELPGGALVDLYPSWSADSTQVRFLRKDSAGVAVMAMPAAGGAPTRLGTLDTDLNRLQDVAWSADSLAWISGSRAEGDAEVLVAALSGDGQRKVLDGTYWVLSLSADGAYLLVDQQDQNGDAVVGKARVVPTRGGKAVPVAPGGVRYPAWAAKGHALAYVERDVVKVVSESGAKPRVLFDGDGEVGAADHRRLGWAPASMLVRTGRDTPVVLRIVG
jgi:Tol biopolymer transport system component